MKPLLILLVFSFLNLTVAERPNILWIVAEDMSPVLECYGDDFAITPNINEICGNSVKYTNAFASAPVCSPSRSCLINGLYATTQGTMQMRSSFPIPKYMKGFPTLLREVGYYTSNNVKTDYNSANWDKIIKSSWDESSATADWRKKKKGQPFFSVMNLMTSHQSRAMVWPYEKFQKEVQSKLSKDQIHDPAKVKLPPYYVDTPVVRKTVARFYDCVTAMDKEVGQILAKLKEDGLEKDTIVFFYSDHGSGMPRHKRALFDSGMHVPLLIHYPEKYKHLAKQQNGSVTDRLVSFVDFAPTVLSLAGVEIPAYMEGGAFSGSKETDPRAFVYGHRDRVDEVIDMARSVRDKRYLYIRNFMPHLSYNQKTAWPDLGEIRHEFYKNTAKSKMTAAQWQFAGPTKPVEELYDTKSDPLNLKNLAASADHKQILSSMRAQLRRNIRKTKDLGFLPEARTWEIIGSATPYEMARANGSYNQEALVAAAFMVGTAGEADFLKNLESKDAGVRYWGAVGLSALDSISAEARPRLIKAYSDSSISVRIEAANAILRKMEAVKAEAVLAEALKSDNFAAILHAARIIENLGSKVKALLPAMKEADARMVSVRPQGAPATVVQPGDIDMAMFVGFSTSSFIKACEKPEGEWEDLFDGKTLNGWTTSTKGQKVEVVDGSITILSKKANLWLLSEKSYKDFELLVEAKMPKEGYNSGIGFRCVQKGKKPIGYQCEIDNKKTGAIYAIGKGWVLPSNGKIWDSFYKTAGDCYKPGEWNKLRIRCVGEHIQIWINGHKTADLKEEKFKLGEGVFALQHHGKGDTHYFKNIKVKNLSK